jgi:hypothetical protein
MSLELQRVKGFFPSMDAIRRSSNPRQIPRIGNRSPLSFN